MRIRKSILFFRSLYGKKNYRQSCEVKHDSVKALRVFADDCASHLDSRSASLLRLLGLDVTLKQGQINSIDLTETKFMSILSDQVVRASFSQMVSGDKVALDALKLFDYCLDPGSTVINNYVIYVDTVHFSKYWSNTSSLYVEGLFTRDEASMLKKMFNVSGIASRFVRDKRSAAYSNVGNRSIVRYNYLLKIDVPSFARLSVILAKNSCYIAWLLRNPSAEVPLLVNARQRTLFMRSLIYGGRRCFVFTSRYCFFSGKKSKYSIIKANNGFTLAGKGFHLSPQSDILFLF